MALIKINTRSIPDAAVTPAKVSQNLGRRNLFINSAMKVSQRGTSFTAVEAAAYHLDRWRSHISGVSSKGICTISQDNDAPSGFSKSLKVVVTTADTSLDAWAEYSIQQKLEGQDLQHLCKGTSSTKQVTISFWVKSSLTGTYILEMLDDDNSSRHINKSYTINSANTWEYKSITFAGDTSGVLDDDNAKSMTIAWHLAGGSNFQGGGLQTSWGSLAQTKRQDGQVNFFGTNANTFQITGCQMELGSVATDFEHRSYGEELSLCQRYFQVLGGTGSNYTLGSGFTTANNFFGAGKLIKTMRSSPSFSHTGAASNFSYTHAAVAANASTSPTFTTNPNTFYLSMASSTTTTNNAGAYARITNSGTLAFFDSEL